MTAQGPTNKLQIHNIWLKRRDRRAHSATDVLLVPPRQRRLWRVRPGMIPQLGLQWASQRFSLCILVRQVGEQSLISPFAISRLQPISAHHLPIVMGRLGEMQRQAVVAPASPPGISLVSLGLLLAPSLPSHVVKTLAQALTFIHQITLLCRASLSRPFL